MQILTFEDFIQLRFKKKIKANKQNNEQTNIHTKKNVFGTSNTLKQSNFAME